MTRIKPAFYKRLCRRLEDYKFHAQAIRDAEKKILELSEDVDTGVDGIDYDKSIVLTSHTSQVVEQIAISRAELEALLASLTSGSASLAEAGQAWVESPAAG